MTAAGAAGAAALAAAHGPRYRFETGPPPPAEAADWLPADRLLAPDTPELARLLDSEHRGSGHRTAHAAALTLIAVYAGRVTAAAMLWWALEGRVLDVRPENVLVRPDPAHGIAGVRLRALREAPPDAPVEAGADGGPGEGTHHGEGTHPGEGTGSAGRAATPYGPVLTRHLLPLAEALHRRTRAGRRQLLGGVAHGCATALCASRADPALLARRWARFTDGAPGGLGALGEVATVHRREPDGTARPRLVYLRRTCCLYYTSAEAVRCVSCCLTSRDERLAAYAAR
ncbi:(2Fe-2S)-binding protein [Streptomyces sp. URMC 123]|uniref:(2Fe-2S)-binding protein n=1 Tax=Streptomyces sp. URMC 123 TaxID=3423403 RepID=UPI003F1B1602